MPRVLIVEDEPTNAELQLVICNTAGYDCEIAFNGCEALSWLERERFDAILLDILMPVMDGLTLLGVLRADPRWTELPVLAVTAKASAANKEEVLRAGANAILTKPFRNQQLREALQSLLSARRDTASA